MISRVKSGLIAALLLICALPGLAATLSDIQVSNGDDQARITFSFFGEPEYTFYKKVRKMWCWILNKPV